MRLSVLDFNFYALYCVISDKRYSLGLSVSRQPRSDMGQARLNWIASLSQITSRVALARNLRA
ncbi:MAG: hypothetical protein ABL861_02055 [Nitrosomonas sp.]